MCESNQLFLCELQEKGINLRHIESRPSRLNKEEFEFYVSVDMACSQALDEVINGLRTQISGHVHELSRNKQADKGVCVHTFLCLCIGSVYEFVYLCMCVFVYKLYVYVYMCVCA